MSLEERRQPNSPKRSFRVFFLPEVGPAGLRELLELPDPGLFLLDEGLTFGVQGGLGLVDGLLGLGLGGLQGHVDLPHAAQGLVGLLPAREGRALDADTLAHVALLPIYWLSRLSFSAKIAHSFPSTSSRPPTPSRTCLRSPSGGGHGTR